MSRQPQIQLQTQTPLKGVASGVKVRGYEVGALINALSGRDPMATLRAITALAHKFVPGSSADQLAHDLSEEAQERQKGGESPEAVAGRLLAELNAATETAEVPETLQGAGEIAELTPDSVISSQRSLPSRVRSPTPANTDLPEWTVALLRISS